MLTLIEERRADAAYPWSPNAGLLQRARKAAAPAAKASAPKRKSSYARFQASRTGAQGFCAGAQGEGVS